MDHIKRRDAGLAYVSDGSVLEQQKRARRLTQALNTADRADFDKIAGIVKELFGKSDGAWVNPPFYCDYGFNIVQFWTWQRCGLAIIVRWPRMWRFIRRATRYIPPRGIPCMNMALKSISGIMSGLAGIPLSARVCGLGIMLSLARAAL